MPFSVGTLHESQSWVEHKQLMKVLLRLAEVLDVVMSYSPGLGLGHPTGVMDVWGSRWLSFFCPWVPWLSCSPGGVAWKVDCGLPLPSVSHPFLRVWAGLCPLKPWHSPPAAPGPVPPVDPPMVCVWVKRSGLCHSFRGSAAVSWPWLQRHTLALLRPTLQNPSPAANWHHLKCVCGTERGPKDGAPWESPCLSLL